jgi:hypothetical protein
VGVDPGAHIDAPSSLSHDRVPDGAIHIGREHPRS